MMDSFLRIDTDLGGKSEEEYQHAGLLTPLPSATDRRSSIASSGQWSFLSYPSSAASLETSQGPTTPPGTDGAFPNDYCVVTSADMSIDGMTFAPLNLKSPFEQLPPAAPCTPVTPTDGFGAHRDADWTWPRRTDVLPQQMAYQTMMPAAIDFGTAFESSLAFNNISEAHVHPVVNSYQADMAPLHMQLMQAGHNMDFLYEPTSDDGMTFHGVDLNHLRHSSIATIAPSQALVEEHLSPVKDMSRAFGSFECEADSRSPSPSGHPMSRMKLEDDPDFTPSVKRSRTMRSMYESPTGGKRVTKEKRRAAMTRRRNRETASVEKYWNNGKVDVQFDGHFRRTEDGCFEPTKKSVKKQVCGKELGDGKICQQAFERIEHLKRHRATHTGIKDFLCPMCSRPFNRNDNLQEHYKTHLLRSKAGRNARTTFEEMFKLIEQTRDPEQAMKSIQTLVKWKNSPKYEQDCKKA